MRRSVPPSARGGCIGPAGGPGRGPGRTSRSRDGGNRNGSVGRRPIHAATPPSAPAFWGADPSDGSEAVSVSPGFVAVEVRDRNGAARCLARRACCCSRCSGEREAWRRLPASLRANSDAYSPPNGRRARISGDKREQARSRSGRDIGQRVSRSEGSVIRSPISGSSGHRFTEQDPDRLHSRMRVHSARRRRASSPCTNRGERARELTAPPPSASRNLSVRPSSCRAPP